MKNKTKMWVLMLSLMIAIVASTAYAVTVTTPASGGTISGTYEFAWTTVETMDSCNATVGTTIMGNNNTAGTSFKLSNLTTGLTDTASTTLLINCTNATDQTATTVTIAVDNTAPSAKVSLSKNIAEKMSPVESDCSASTDAIDTSLSYSQQLYDPDGTAVSSACTTAVCEWDDGDLENLGENYVTCTVTDNGGNTNAQTDYVTVNSGDDATRIVLGNQKSNRNIMFAGLILLVLIVVIAVVAVTVKKKKRK